MAVYELSEISSQTLRDAPRRIYSQSQCGIFLCTCGTLSVRLLSGLHKIGSGDIIIFHPFVKAEFVNVTHDCRGYYGTVSLTNALPVLNQVVNSRNLDAVRKDPVVSLSPTQMDAVMVRFNQYFELARDSAADDGDEIRVINNALLQTQGASIMLQILKIYFTEKQMDGSEMTSHDKVLQNFMLDLRRYSRKERSTRFYADRSNLSPKYFSALIRKNTGAAPIEWIIQSVIAEAKFMLDEHSLTIKEVSDSLNFPSQAFFTKYFSRYTGMTPTEYRKRQ